MSECVWHCVCLQQKGVLKNTFVFYNSDHGEARMLATELLFLCAPCSPHTLHLTSLPTLRLSLGAIQPTGTYVHKCTVCSGTVRQTLVCHFVWGEGLLYSSPSSQGEKRQPYDEDIRVPLIVRGPGIKPNTKASPIALSIDMASGARCHITRHCQPPMTASLLTVEEVILCHLLLSLQFPTFLDLAGVQPQEDLDGRSLKSIFLGQEEEEVL